MCGAGGQRCGLGVVMKKDEREKGSAPCATLPAGRPRPMLPSRGVRRVRFNGVAGIEEAIEREAPEGREPSEHVMLGEVSEPLS